MSQPPRYRRNGPIPAFGRPGYYYNYPALIVASPTIGSTDEYPKSTVLHANGGELLTKNYFVDVPYGVYPGEVIRVLIVGREFLVTVPEIRSSGERIVVNVVEEEAEVN